MDVLCDAQENSNHGLDLVQTTAYNDSNSNDLDFH